MQIPNFLARIARHMRAISSTAMLLILLTTASFGSLALAPSAHAASSSDDVDLSDYFIFEEGTWWDYVDTISYDWDSDVSDYNIVDNTEDATYRVKAVHCNVTKCFSYSYNNEYVLDYYIDGNEVVLRLTYTNGNQDDFLLMSLDGVSGEISDWLELVLTYSQDIDIDQYDTFYECDTYIQEDYSYGDYDGAILVNECSLYMEYDHETYGGDAFNMSTISTDYYLKDLGYIYSENELYYGTDWQYTTYTEMVDSSLETFAMVDAAADEEVELSDEDEGKALATTEEDLDSPDDVVLADDSGNSDDSGSDENGNSDAPSAPSDVTTAHRNHDAIIALYEEGIVGGYSDGTFKPNDGVNRAELLKILVEGLGITPDESTYANCFPDVTDDWYAKYVCYAKEEGWVEGYPDGYFRPADAVNKVEALKMLLNSQSVDTAAYEASATDAPFEDVATDAWYAPFVTAAKELGILEEDGSTNYEPGNSMTRGGMCEALWRLISG